MKTMFRSQELWELVENGNTNPNPSPAQPDQQLRETRKKDAKALFLIQSALADDIFPRIVAATTSNEAWKILKQEFLGDRKVITAKLQTLHHEFETLTMKERVFLSRMFAIVSQMKTYGEDVSNQIVVSKVLRSLTANFDYIVAAIEESKELFTYTFDELMSFLQAHETRVSRSSEKAEEKAFQVKEETSKYSDRGRG